jgi:hypothetical protein
MTKRDEAFAKAREAKARFEGSLDVARRNLTPVKLGQRATSKTKRAVEARPVASAAIGTAVLALIFRKPLAGLIRRLRKELRHD